jgi:hypothetical protein
MPPYDAFRRAGRSAGFLVLSTLATAPAARALPEWGAQIPHLDQAGGCDGFCHATGFTDSQFYKDFQSAGYVWNATMAASDSDGDGFSNGWELQNPPGDWVSGTPQPGSAALVSDPVSAGSFPPLPVATAPTVVVHEEAAGQNVSEPLAVQNVGAVPFDWSISSTEPWMTADPASGSALPASQQDELLVLFVTDGLAAGPHSGALTVTIPGIRSDRIPTVPVDLTIPEPGAFTCASSALLGLGLFARRGSPRR